MTLNHIESKIPGNGISYVQIMPVGKTIATLDGCQYNLHRFLDRITGENSTSLVFMPDDDRFKLNENYRACSKVNYDGGDTFDGEIGCEISKSKVMKKYHSDFDEGILRFLHELRSVEAALQLYCDKHGINYDFIEIPEEIKLRKFSNYYGRYED